MIHKYYFIFELIYNLTRREVIGRYKNSYLGLLWSFLIPVLMLTIYTFVFGYVFASKWDGSNNTLEFSLILFSGLICYTFFADSINKSPLLIITNVNYIKKIVFPVVILPVVSVLSNAFNFFVGFIILEFFYYISYGYVYITSLFVPLIILPLFLITLGLVYIISSVGVFLRDVSQTIGLFTSFLLFLSPIFYPASILPEKIRPYLFLNPLTFIIEQVRDVSIYGNQPAYFRLFIYYIISIGVLLFGIFLFKKLENEFADVL